MRLLIQRVSRASVVIHGELIGRIQEGLLVLVGIGMQDTEDTAVAMVEKLLNLRIFSDDDGKMNLNISQAVADQPLGGLLLVSQFTLYGDCRKGRRPSFEQAAPPERAQALYNFVVATAQGSGIRVQTGAFREHMQVELVNDGPVTLMLDSAELFPAK
ncbi:MAG: D-tyrosyl-tRNA(Tyr) deacylase [Bryobacterales bacterium]|nr:D-tyrosyl-tRNA(Tyr) deacylase [Bryobacterales bacterium]